MSTYAETHTLLQSLKLKGAARSLDSLLEAAQGQEMSFADFLHHTLQAEITDRAERRLTRNLTASHLPVEKRLEDFDFSRLTGVRRSEAMNLLDFRWIDMHENLVFFGPPGLGKTHLAIAISLKALHAGYTVCFERMSNLVRLLKTAELQRASAFRMNRILRSHVLVIDEIGYTPIDRKEGNLFFNLVSELYEWAELMGDEIMTTAMLDRLLHHAHIYSMNGDSYRVANSAGKEGTKSDET